MRPRVAWLASALVVAFAGLVGLRFLMPCAAPMAFLDRLGLPVGTGCAAPTSASGETAGADRARSGASGRHRREIGGA